MNTPKAARKGSTQRENEIQKLIKGTSPSQILKAAKDSLHVLDSDKKKFYIKVTKSVKI